LISRRVPACASTIVSAACPAYCPPRRSIISLEIALYEGITELASAEQPKMPRARAFAKHCFGLADAQGLIAASRFELKNIPKLSPYALVLGVIDHGQDFRVRQAGTKFVADFFGVDPTGRLFSERLRDDEFGRRSWYIARQAVHLKKPILNQPGRTWLREKDFLTLETVTFPLVDESGAVVKLTVIFDFAYDRGREG
jgi:hypothetical protein